MRLGPSVHEFAVGSKLEALGIPSNGLHGVVVQPPNDQSLPCASAKPGTFVGRGMSAFWVHEFADPQRIADCTRAALDAFAGWAGGPCLYFRAGAGFVSNEMIEVAEQCGVQVDLSLEPVAGWGLRATSVPTSVDESPMVGDYTDCHGAPRVAFRPAHHDFRVPDGKGGRRLVMVPLTTVPVDEETAPRQRSLLDRLRGRDAGSGGDVQMLYPSVDWPTPLPIPQV